MSSFNRVFLLGRLTSDPAVYEGNNAKIVRFNLAVNEKRGEKEETLFIDVVAFGKRAETISKYFTKGTPILVEGRLRFSQFEDKQGIKRSKHDVVLQNFSFVGTKGQNKGHSSHYENRSAYNDTSLQGEGHKSHLVDINNEEDIPF